MTTEPYAIASICGSLGALHVYKPRDNAPRQSLSGCHIKTANSCCQLSATQLLCLTRNSSSSATNITTYNLNRAAGGASNRCTAPEPQLCCITSSPCGGYIVAGAPSGRCYIWASSTGQLLNSWSAHLQAVTNLAFTDDSLAVLTSGADGAVHLFGLYELVDFTREKAMNKPPVPQVSLRGHTLPISVLSVGYGGGSARVLTAGNDRCAKLWHLHSAKCVGTIRLISRATAGILAHDEGLAYVGCADGSVVVFEVTNVPQDVPISCKNVPKIAPPMDVNEEVSVLSMALSPAGTELVVGYSDGIVRIFNAMSRTLVSVYGKHSTTAGIECVITMLRMPQLDVETGASDDIANDVCEHMMHEGVVFAKVRDPEIENKFVPKIDMSIGQTVQEGCLDALEKATQMCFSEMDTWIEEKESKDNTEMKNIGNTNEESKLPVELLKEIEMLRERNQLLEALGTKIVEMAEGLDT